MADPVLEMKAEDLMRWVVRIQEAVNRVFQGNRPDSLPRPPSSAPRAASASPADTYAGPKPNLPWEGARCGPLRNSSLFGCNYLQTDGRHTLLGFDLKPYDQGFGLSLKISIGN